MPGVPVYQAPEARKGWFRDHDGVPAIYVHQEDSQEYPFHMDQELAQELDDTRAELITAVSWVSYGPTISGAAVGLQAKSLVKFTGIPTADDTLVVNDTTITAKASTSAVDEFEQGSTAAQAATNLAACINAGSEADVVFAAVDSDGTGVIITWIEAGTVGNSKVITESLDNATLQDADGNTESTGLFGAYQAGTSETPGVEGRGHVATVTGTGDAVVTLTTTLRTLKRRYRWKPVPRSVEDYR